MRRTLYVLYRVLGMVPTVLGVIVLIFILSRSIQGDPARMMAATRPINRFWTSCVTSFS